MEMETEILTPRARTGARTNPPANDAKPAAVDAAPADPETLFAAAVTAINGRYQLGTLEHLQDDRPDLADELARAFDRVNDTWRESEKAGPLASPAFKLALRTWYNLTIMAIDYIQGRRK